MQDKSTTNKSDSRSRHQEGQRSLNLFKQFVVVDENNNVDASRILSRECFEAWLSVSNSQKPEDTFRKILTSHIRGTDRKKPFPPEIEAALLREVRVQRVWPCFNGYSYESGEDISIGLRGFQGTGFHEQQFAQPGGTKRKAVEAPSRITESDLISEAVGAWKNAKTMLMMLLQRLKVKPSDLSLENVDDPLIIYSPQANPRTVRGQVIYAVVRYVKPSRVFAFMSTMEYDGFMNWIEGPAMDMKLADIHDPKFESSFLFPQEQLIPGRMTGNHIICLETFRVIYQDTNAKKMLGECVGKIPWTLSGTSIAILFAKGISEAYPVMLRQGHCMYHGVNGNADGTSSVYRIRYTMLPDSKVKSEFQNVSDLYPGILAACNMKELL